MTRAQFLNDLYHHLYGMTREQAEQHLTYYAEMLADRMEEGMTEEEAVAGMEDVETIARRIMEEEGLPYTPPEQRPTAPPEYPDASKLPGGGGTRAYQAPRGINWRRIGRIALGVTAAAVALGAGSRWMWRNLPFRRPDISADTVTQVVEEAASQAPYVDEYYYMEAPYAEGYEYAGETYDYDCGDVNGVDIQWASGVVYVQSWSEDCIQVREYGQSELNGRTEMSCQTDGDTLTVRYRNGGGLGSVKGRIPALTHQDILSTAHSLVRVPSVKRSSSSPAAEVSISSSSA